MMTANIQLRIAFRIHREEDRFGNKKCVLVHIYLNTRIASIEIRQHFGAVLPQSRSDKRPN